MNDFKLKCKACNEGPCDVDCAQDREACRELYSGAGGRCCLCTAPGVQTRPQFTYRVSFRIRMIYLAMIIEGLKKTEVRRMTPFWIKRATRVNAEIMKGNKVMGVFVCGKVVHRRQLELAMEYESAEDALGRPPSDQGKKDIGEGPVIGFNIGDVVK